MDKEKFKEEIKYTKEDYVERIKQIATKFEYDAELTDLLLTIYTRVYGQASYEIQQNFLQTL